MAQEQENQGMESQRPEAGVITIGEPENSKKDDDTIVVRRGEYSGIKKQLAEHKKALAEINAAKEAEAQEKARAAQNFQEIEKNYAEKLAQANGELAKMRRGLITERARLALRDAGMRPGLAIDGAVAMIPEDFDADNISEWVSTIKQAHAAEFVPVSNPVSSPSAGSTGRPAANEGEALKRKWESVVSDKRQPPHVLAAVQREIQAYITRTGKDPLLQ